jgi:hypothetical protein
MFIAIIESVLGVLAMVAGTIFTVTQIMQVIRSLKKGP